MKFKHSVIIPFCDKYDLMRKAISSIPERSDIQIILVYNGKKEFPVSEIPQREKNTVTFLVSDSSKGAGHARNVGLENVQGEYVYFLDSDDYFTHDAFIIFDKYVNSQYDIVYFKANGIFLKTGLPSARHMSYNNIIDEYRKDNSSTHIRFNFDPPYCKMIKYNFINSNRIRFEEVRVSNDSRFSIMLGYYAKDIYADNSVVYVVTEGEENQSLVKTRTPENMFIRFQVQIRNNKFLKEIGHFENHVRLLGAMRIALCEFGIKEFMKYIKYAIKEKAWIF